MPKVKKKSARRGAPASTTTAVRTTCASVTTPATSQSASSTTAAVPVDPGPDGALRLPGHQDEDRRGLLLQDGARVRPAGRDARS